MASSEHIALSDYIKSVHEKLRQDTKILGADEAWSRHISDEKILNTYSKAMQDLACNFWDKNSKLDSKAVSRVQWTHEACQEYFRNISKFREKEGEILEKLGLVLDEDNCLQSFTTLNLLDVGSCYNPFKDLDCYNVIGIDIAPASETVLKCDFINVFIDSKFVHHQNTVKELPKNNFHVIVFSLLLEYLPTPELRYICCENAYKLLKTEGILVIITPDSKHIGSNAQIIKSWKFILSDMGFSRIKYEKLPYLHCMVFRKALDSSVTRRWADLHRKMQVYDKMYIPQDFKIEKKEIKKDPN